MITKAIQWFFDNFFAVEEQYRINRKIFVIMFVVTITIVLLIKVGQKTKFFNHVSRRSAETKVVVDETFKTEIKDRQAHERALAELEWQKKHNTDKPHPKKLLRGARKSREKRKKE
jgi:hypothetical protein